MIDPFKDKLAYFKDNIQTAEDKEDYDPSQYYYHRDEFSGKGLASQASTGGPTLSRGNSQVGLNGLYHPMTSIVGGLDGQNNNLMMGGRSMMTNPMDGAPQHGGYTGFNGAASMGNPMHSLLGARSHSSIGMGSPVGLSYHQRMNSNSVDHMAAIVKGRGGFPNQGHEQTLGAPDLSEFPALGSRMDLDNSSSSFDASVEARLRSQPTEFQIQKEDFPALTTFTSTNSSNGAASVNGQQPDSFHHQLSRHHSFISSANDETTTSNTTSGAIIGNHRDNRDQTSESSNLDSGSSFNGVHPHQSSHATDDLTETASDSPDSRYGLLGMLNTVIHPGADVKKNLPLGCDLTSLGLNLNSPEPLHPTFASPWADGPLTHEPQFSVPVCYYNPRPEATHVSKFQLETLFFIFYTMPQDVLQALAAQELYSREWRYHGEMRTWLKRATAADASVVAAATSKDLSEGKSTRSFDSTSEPQFLYFDSSKWEQRLFLGDIRSISTGLMSEEDIRVKFATTQSGPSS